MSTTSLQSASRGLIALGYCLVVVSPFVLGGCPSRPVRNPKASATRYKLGHDYFRRALKAKSEAERSRFVNVSLLELQRSVKADDQNHHAHFLLGLLYLYKGKKTLDDAEILQCATGDARREFVADADKLMRLAQKHLKRAYDLRGGKDSRIALNLSTVALHFRRFEQAERYARVALSNIAYNTPHLARGNIGRSQFERGKLHKALKNLKQAVFSESRFCAGHYWLGRVLFALKKYVPAARRFGQALSCCDREHIAPIQEARLYRGLSLMRSGEAKQALVALQECVKQAPRSCVAARCKLSLRAVAGSSRP